MNNIPEQSTIIIVLSIGTVVGPIVFGFLLSRMSQIFVTKEIFETYKKYAESQREDMKGYLRSIEIKVDRLLERNNRND